MYEELSYDIILDRMLERVPDDIDKREGSIIMNALAPAAMEIYMAYFELGRIIDESYADTQSRDFLIRRAAEMGIEPDGATYAQWSAEIVGSDIVGKRFSAGDLSFTATEQTGVNTYNLSCEQLGTQGNSCSDSLIAIDSISNLTSLELGEISVYASDEEDTETFRTRYFENITSQAFGGNVADYKAKALSIEGVGDVKVVPVWDGAGTVKLVIVGADGSVPSNDFITEIQDTFDPVYGQGLGLAPIGHKCTVQAVETVDIDITCTVEGEDIDQKLSLIESAVDTYFQKQISLWGSLDKITIRISQIESAILDVDGVCDVSGTTIDGQEENLSLDFDQIPVRGDIDVTVA